MKRIGYRALLVMLSVAAVFGVQMASAYIGSCLMPPLFGFLARHVGIALFPFYLLAVLLLMVFMHERVIFQASESR